MLPKKKFLRHMASGEYVAPADATLPSTGANFVDVDLRVVVQSAAGRVTGFQTSHRHGTTLAHNVINHGTCTRVSTCLARGAAAALAAGRILSVTGAGTGSDHE